MYNLTFICFNFALLLEEQYGDNKSLGGLIKEIEEIVIYFLTGITILLMLADLFAQESKKIKVKEKNPQPFKKVENKYQIKKSSRLQV